MPPRKRKTAAEKRRTKKAAAPTRSIAKPRSKETASKPQAKKASATKVSTEEATGGPRTRARTAQYAKDKTEHEETTEQSPFPTAVSSRAEAPVSAESEQGPESTTVGGAGALEHTGSGLPDHVQVASDNANGRGEDESNKVNVEAGPSNGNQIEPDENLEPLPGLFVPETVVQHLENLIFDSNKLQSIIDVLDGQYARWTREHEFLRKTIWRWMIKSATSSHSSSDPPTEDNSLVDRQIDALEPGTALEKDVLELYDSLERQLVDVRRTLNEDRKLLLKALLAVKDACLAHLSNLRSGEGRIRDNLNELASQQPCEVYDVRGLMQSGRLDEAFRQQSNAVGPESSVSDVEDSLSIKTAARNRFHHARRNLLEVEGRFEWHFHPWASDEQRQEYEELLSAGEDLGPMDAYFLRKGQRLTAEFANAQSEYSKAATEARRLQAVPTDELTSRFASVATAADSVVPDVKPERVVTWARDIPDNADPDHRSSFRTSRSRASMRHSASSNFLTGQSQVYHDRQHRHRQKWQKIRRERWTDSLRNWEARYGGTVRPPDPAGPDIVSGDVVQRKAEISESVGQRAWRACTTHCDLM